MGFKEFWLGKPIEKQLSYREAEQRIALSYDAAQNQPRNTIPNLNAANILPPTRSGASRVVTVVEAMTLDAAQRCVNILATLMSSLEIEAVNRLGKPLTTQPSLVRRPDPNTSRYVTIKQITTSLATYGEFFWYLPGRSGPSGEVVSIELLNPSQVHIRRGKRYEPVYSMFDSNTGQWSDVPRWQIQHGTLQQLPGDLHGRGPIQNCQGLFRSAVDLAEFANGWWTDGGIPTGILKTDQEMNPELAEMYRQRWYETQEKRQIAVLGNGLTYEDTKISPKDALFTEISQAQAVQIARAFGVPAVAIDANFQMDSSTYVNMSQRNEDLLVYTLASYIYEIENAFSEILPNGTVMKFKTDSLTTDLSAQRRWIGYQAAVGNKPFMTVNEVRDLEHLDPLPGGDVLTSEPAASSVLEPGTSFSPVGGATPNVDNVGATNAN